MDAEIVLREPHAPERINGRAQNLDLRQHGLLADDVAVPLVVLALASLRGALIAEALRDRVPLQWEAQLVLTRRHHARQRRRHLGAERQMTVALVVEVVDLLAHLLACLAREQLVALNHARIVRDEAGGLARRAERIKHPIAPRHVFGIEVPHAARRLKTDLTHRSFPSSQFHCSILFRFFQSVRFCFMPRIISYRSDCVSLSAKTGLKQNGQFPSKISSAP